MARREFYFELLTGLKAAHRAQQRAVFVHDEPMPDVLSDEAIDRFDARLEMDASPEVRMLAGECFRLIQRFYASRLMGAPAELDEFDLYHYRFDLTRDQPEEAARLHMRMALGGIHDDLGKAIGKVSERVRREVHGRRSAGT
ncbi:hypothetical protein [Microbacterium sp.]|uniref:hypothetical protein n=1 Tax=Microbacterium sp. TaxID=51671 RepID=UPI0027355FE8|nr:hypothetical protein [Microbacterium sp.]MDP3949622.1 hypothetical protein [Microbacterium sp.]